MKTDDIAKKLLKGKDVYIYDSYSDVAVRYTYDGEKETAYLKTAGGKEKKVAYGDAYDYAAGGEEITKEQYDKL